jgi:hypothetical protein
MDLITGGSGNKRNVTEEQLLAAFASDKALRDWVGLANEDGSILRAVGEGFGPYTLELFPSKRSGTHLMAAAELKKQEVRDALVDYLRGGSAWRNSYTWLEVDDETFGGCLQMILMSISVLLIVAGVCFIVYALGKTITFPEGTEAHWSVTGLICLGLGAVFLLSRRLWPSRRTPGEGKPAGVDRFDS